MILARRMAGITNTSSCLQKASTQNYYATATTGKDATLLCVVGNTPQSYNVSKTQYTEILSGKGYRYLLNRSTNTVWMDVPDGTYVAPLEVKITAVSSLSGAKIVYTLDGSTPTPDSPQMTSGATLDIESTCTLTAGILSAGKVQGIQQRNYTIFEPHDITLYVSSDISWPSMTFYVWDNNDTQLSGNWPGKRVTTSENIEGKRWFYQTYRLTSPSHYVNLVVSNTGGNRQTVDVTGIRTDRYLCISATKDGSKYLVEDQTTDIETPIRLPKMDDSDDFLPQKSHRVSYDLQGLPVRSDIKKKGIIIEGDRKVAY